MASTFRATYPEAEITAIGATEHFYERVFGKEVGKSITDLA